MGSVKLLRQLNIRVSPVLTARCVQVPVWLLKATRNFLRSFQWARDAADRLVSRHRSHAC